MKAKPNLTVIEGMLRAIRKDPGGYGSNMEIEVERNASPAEDADFMKPKKGDRLTLFAAEAPAAEAGQRVRVRARLLAGPFGERSVVEHLEVIADPADGT